MTHDVFISYFNKDIVEAMKVYHVLEQNGLNCWIATDNIPSGRPYADELYHAIERTKIVLLIFSKYSQDSSPVLTEIKNAYSFEKPILTLRIDKTIPDGDFSYYLNNDQWMDAYPNLEDRFDDMIQDVLDLCGSNDHGPVWWSLKDFVPEDLSKQKKDYVSLMLLFTPLYWASFLYMGLIADVNLWKVMGFVYLVPSVVCFVLYYQIWKILFVVYPVFAFFSYLFIIFWILALFHRLIIRDEFLTRRFILRFISSNDEFFDMMYDEYSND